MFPCRANPDQFFSTDLADLEASKESCLNCPQMIACRDRARECGEKHGVWGGEDAGERAAWLVSQGVDIGPIPDNLDALLSYKAYGHPDFRIAEALGTTRQAVYGTLSFVKDSRVRRPLTEEEIDLFLKMRAEGYTYWQCAAVLGVPRTKLRYLVKRDGDAGRFREASAAAAQLKVREREAKVQAKEAERAARRAVKNDQAREVQALAARGFSGRRIARMLGITTRQVGNGLRRTIEQTIEKGGQTWHGSAARRRTPNPRPWIKHRHRR